VMRLLRVVVLVVGFSSLGFAQTGTSVITGAVMDASGGAIPSVDVTLTNQETGTKQQTVTNDTGSYRFAALPPGTYRIEAQLVGFERLSRGPITLQVSQTLAMDLTLQVGQIGQTVDVTEAAPLIDSQTSDVGQAVTRQMIAALPLPNRAASSLAALAPGVVMIDNGTGTAENYPVFSVAGGRARNQNFMLDGGNVSNAVGLTRPQQLTSLPVDAMQEFKVIANNYSAEFGHSTGGVVTMSTRSGTNAFHGSLFESLRNDIFDASNFFAAKKAPIRLNQFGGAIGGPISKDKTHFFATWEQTRQTTSETITSTVPTLANRAGDFSDLRDGQGNPILIYDPATTSGRNRLPFQNNRIPPERIDPVARAVLNYIPLPNRQGTATSASNYVGNSSSTLHRNIVVGRLDHQFRASDLVTARYYINDSGTATTGTYGIPVSDPLGDSTDVRVQSILGAYTHLFGSNLANELRYTYLRRKFIDKRPGYKEKLAATIGLTGVSDAAFPAFTIPGYATLGNPGAVFRFQTPIIDQQILDSISWTRGKHAFKFGGEFRAGANDEIRDRGSAGNFTFTPLITSLPGVAGTGNAFASLLLGEVNAASIQVSDKIPSRASYWSFYAQDDWRVTRNLTLTYGLRWEAELPRKVVGSRMNSFDPLAINPVSGTPGVVTFAGINGVPERAFRTDTNNFGPRFGFAYKIPGAGSTLLRGGSGIFYGPTVSNTIGDVAALGFSTTASYVVPQADLQSVFHLQDGFPAVTRAALDAGFGAVPLGQRPNTSVTFFNPGQVAPTSYQFNLNLQRELTKDLLVEVGYIGNVSHHLTANDLSLNQVAPELTGAGDAQARRPFPQFSNVTWINPSIGNSSYHGGFVRAEKRFSGSFSFLANYTFSKFLDDVESANEYGATGSYMDAYHRNLDKGVSGSDVPHHVVITLLYESRGVGRSRLLNSALGGWKIGVLETFMSGPPFTVITASNTTNAFPAGSLRPNLLRNPELPSSERTVTRWFDTTAFAAPAPFTFGNSPRSVLRGDPLFTTDLTTERSFRLSERYKFELRGEFYNLLNHANFNVPGFTYGAADFGVVTSARPGRTVQLAARLAF
jgi:Carboxypeptidase regulatory-like domain/TonB-dependent Receptor Plug Domain